MRRQSAALALDVDDAIVIEPVVRRAARIMHSVELRRLADELAELVAADGRTSFPVRSLPEWSDSSTITTDGAAQMLGVTPRTVRRRAAARQIPARKVRGRWEIGA